MATIDTSENWRPFGNPEVVVKRLERDGRRASFIVDPWTQRWAIIAVGGELLVTLADGNRTLSEIVRAVTESSDNFDLRNPSTVTQLALELAQRGILFPSKVLHDEVGQPVYNRSEILGLHLEITNACNLQCRHCYVSSGLRLPNELSDAELRAVVDQLPPFSGRVVAISGGEPAVRKGCMDLVAYCAIQRGHIVDLYTNGYRFPRRLCELLVEVSSQSEGRVRLQLSLEGATARTNDVIRGQGAFEQALATLRMFREFGLNRQTTIFVCITKFNIGQLDELFRLCETYDVARLHFSQWQRQGNASDVPWASIAPSTEEWVAAGEKVLRYDNPCLTVSGNFFGDLKNAPSGQFTLDYGLFPKHLYFYNAFPRISPDGMIFADQFWTHPDWSLGNVRETTLETAFASPKFEEQLVALRSRIERVDECKSCEWQSLCECGSPGHTHAEYGHLWKKDLFCEARIRWFERYMSLQADAALLPDAGELSVCE